MENEQAYYYKTEAEGDRDENEDHELSSFLQELIYPEPGCIDTLMNPNPNPNPDLGHPEEDGTAVEVDQPKNGSDGFADRDNQPSSLESSSSSAVNAKEPISTSNVGERPMIVQATRVSDLEVVGPRLDQVRLLMDNAASLASSVDTGGDPIEKHHTSNPKRKTPSAWTEEEHTAFLHGIRDGFSGDWKNMSKIYVKRRSPTQIASHAQKYFKRQQSGNPRRRKSINDLTLSNISTPITKVSFTHVDQQPLPAASLYNNISQSPPSNNSLPQPNPNWVVPVGTELPPLPPPRPVEEGRLYMASQRHESSSSSSSSYIPPVLSPLPQQMVPNYSLINPHDQFHAYLSAQQIWRGTTIHPHHQPPTLTSSSWPLQQRSYNHYYPPMPPMMFNPSLFMDHSPVNHTSHLTFNPDMARPPSLPNQDHSNNIKFYP